MSIAAHDRTLARQLSRAFVTFGVLVSTAFLATALSYVATWAWLTPERERNEIAVRAAGNARTAMLDQEDYLRGYLLTRDPLYLEPYRRGQELIAHANHSLTAYIGAGSGIAEVAEGMVRTRLAEHTWRERYARRRSLQGG